MRISDWSSDVCSSDLYRGRLNQLMLELMASDYMEREVFCCGPEPFMQTVRDILNAAGFDMTHYHEESFQAPIRVEEQIPEHDDVMPEAGAAAIIGFRSEEHPSELQSLMRISYAVFCLKQKKPYHINHHYVLIPLQRPKHYETTTH